MASFDVRLRQMCSTRTFPRASLTVARSATTGTVWLASDERVRAAMRMATFLAFRTLHRWVRLKGIRAWQAGPMQSMQFFHAAPAGRPLGSS